MTTPSNPTFCATAVVYADPTGSLLLSAFGDGASVTRARPIGETMPTAWVISVDLGASRDAILWRWFSPEVAAQLIGAGATAEQVEESRNGLTLEIVKTDPSRLGAFLSGLGLEAVA